MLGRHDECMSSPEAAGAAPGLSVVIPVYGNERTLLRALDSIDAACQAEPSDYPVQVVVAFDGLIDSSDALVAGWVAGSPRVTVCPTLEEHRGIASARNAGIALASHDVITFLDADDEVTAERLALAPTLAPDGSEVIIGVQRVRVENGASIPGPYVPASATDERRPQFYPTSMLVRRSTLRQIGGFNESFSVGDDVDIVMRMIEAGVRLRMVTDCVAVRYFHGDNASYDQSSTEGDFLLAVRSHLQRMRESTR